MTDRMIPSVSDEAARKANDEAIDRLVGECRYPYIVAWGKFLGFTPEAVQEYVREAEANDAPPDAIQKIDGEWLTVTGIRNETNRKRVLELANSRLGALVSAVDVLLEIDRASEDAYAEALDGGEAYDAAGWNEKMATAIRALKEIRATLDGVELPGRMATKSRS